MFYLPVHPRSFFSSSNRLLSAHYWEIGSSGASCREAAAQKLGDAASQPCVMLRKLSCRGGDCHLPHFGAFHEELPLVQRWRCRNRKTLLERRVKKAQRAP